MIIPLSYLKKKNVWLELKLTKKNEINYRADVRFFLLSLLYLKWNDRHQQTKKQTDRQTNNKKKLLYTIIYIIHFYFFLDSQYNNKVYSNITLKIDQQKPKIYIYIYSFKFKNEKITQSRTHIIKQRRKKIKEERTKLTVIHSLIRASLRLPWVKEASCRHYCYCSDCGWLQESPWAIWHFHCWH